MASTSTWMSFSPIKLRLCFLATDPSTILHQKTTLHQKIFSQLTPPNATREESSNGRATRLQTCLLQRPDLHLNPSGRACAQALDLPASDFGPFPGPRGLAAATCKVQYYISRSTT